MKNRKGRKERKKERKKGNVLTGTLQPDPAPSGRDSLMLYESTSGLTGVEMCMGEEVTVRRGSFSEVVYSCCRWLRG